MIKTEDRLSTILPKAYYLSFAWDFTKCGHKNLLLSSLYMASVQIYNTQHNITQMSRVYSRFPRTTVTIFQLFPLSTISIISAFNKPMLIDLL